jgi:RNA polymerase sigma factor (TIGR02999 family)
MIKRHLASSWPTGSRSSVIDAAQPARPSAATQPAPAHEALRGEVTLLLDRLADGDAVAWDPLMDLVYGELRRIAHARLRCERGGTLGTTALVHEASLRLLQIDGVAWQNRRHFFAVAARAMRRLLIDRARATRRLKRGGESAPRVEVEFESIASSVALNPEHLIALDQALNRLGALHERQRQVVELRFFMGLTIEETSEALGVGRNTVKRDWETARRWLNRELTG